MESAKLLAGCGDHLGAAGFGCEIGVNYGGFAGAADFARYGFELFAGARGENDFGAFRGEAKGDSAADAAACAGDNGDFFS